METTTGLKQGCPLSATLFTLYITELEQRLIREKIGFEVRIRGDFWNVREKKTIEIPGLLFADDLVLLIHGWKDMQKLLDVTSQNTNMLEEISNIYTTTQEAANCLQMREQDFSKPESSDQDLRT